MSKLKVNEIDTESGTTVTVTAGKTLDVPATSTLTVAGTQTVTGTVNLASSTLTLPATLPATAGTNITSIPGANITGTIPLAALGNAPETDVSGLKDDIALIAFQTQANGSLARYNLVDQSVDSFEDASGIASNTGGSRNATGNYYSGEQTGATLTATGGAGAGSAKGSSAGGTGTNGATNGTGGIGGQCPGGGQPVCQRYHVPDIAFWIRLRCLFPPGAGAGPVSQACPGGCGTGKFHLWPGCCGRLVYRSQDRVCRAARGLRGLAGGAGSLPAGDDV